MATNIGKLAVTLSTDTSRFTTGMQSAAGVVSRVQASVARATDTVKAWEATTASVKPFKLASTDTLDSFRTAAAVARSELNKLGRNKDVRVAIEIGREYLDESWIKARQHLTSLAQRAKLDVAASVISSKTGDALDWTRRQQRRLTKPISVRMELASRGISDGIAAAGQKLDALRRFRGVRIAIAATNAMKLPTQAALATLGPLRRMATTGLSVGLRATHWGVVAGVSKAKSALSGFTSLAAGALGPVAVAGGALTAGLGGLVGYSVKLAADSEQAKVAFTTMLGSSQAAVAMLGQINQFAATTPFQTPELIDASKKLLAFGVAADQVLPTMRTLGDLSAGLNIPLGDLAEIFGKAKVQGRLMAEDINQLTGRGIPVIGEFAKQFGVAEGDVRGLVEAGQIGFPQLQKALASLTGEGGKFAGMMDAQSQTVTGLWSTMEDTVTLSLTRLGSTIIEKMDLRGVIGGVTESLSVLADSAMPVIESFIGSLSTGGNMGQQAGQMVLSGAELIATGLAYAIDYSKLLVVAFKSMQSGAAYAIGGVLKAVDFLGSGIVKLLNYLPGVNIQWTDTIGAMGDAVLDEAKKLDGEAAGAWEGFTNNDSAKRVGAFFDGVRNKAQQAAQGINQSGKDVAGGMKIMDTATGSAAAKALDALKADTAKIGTEDGGKVAELTKLGATPEQIAQAKEMIGLQDRLKGMGKVSAADPFGDFGKKITDLQTLATQGKITADQLNGIKGSAVLSLAENVKISGDDALTEYASAMQKLQALYAAGKVTSDQFATIRASAQTSLNDTLAEQAKSLTHELRTPLEAYQSEIKKLTAMFDKGLIDQSTLDRATAKARDTLSGGKTDPSEPDKNATAIRAGSQEAIRFAFDSARGPSKLSSPVELAKASLKQQEKQTAALNTLVRASRDTTTEAPDEVTL